MGGVSVSGGYAGITARTEQMTAMARTFGQVASGTLHAAWTMHGYAFDPGLAASAILDPLGYARFEFQLFDALDGPGGLSWAGLECGALDCELRLAAAAYSAADELYRDGHDAVVGVLLAPAALGDAASVLASGGGPLAAAQAAIARDPELADDLVDVLGVPALLSVLAHEERDGRGVAHALGTDTSGSAGQPPRRLTDIMLDLGQRDNDAHHGAVDVRILTLPDGTRRAIVDITGTKSWTLSRTPDITSLTTNGRAVVGERTAYEQGVLAAMRRAGVRRGDDVMIVGHSEGGMVAVNTARDAVRSGEFHVTHVMTAGAPIGLTVGSLPRRVQVLALENVKDVVPHLDGRANPDLPNVTTATSSHGDGSVLDDHSIGGAYLPIAGDAQASDDASVRHFLSTAAGYFRGTHVETKTYQVVRRY